MLPLGPPAAIKLRIMGRSDDRALVRYEWFLRLGQVADLHFIQTSRKASLNKLRVEEFSKIHFMMPDRNNIYVSTVNFKILI